MKVKRLQVDGFRGLPDRDFLFGDPSGKAPNLVVVTGPTGSGKTSFLEAIIAGKERVAGYGAVGAPAQYLRPGVTGGKVKITWETDATERERFGIETMTIDSEALFGATLTTPEIDPGLQGMLLEYDVEPTSSKVEYFHATRRLRLGSAADPTQLGNSSLSDKAIRLTRDDAKYGGLVRFVVAAAMGLDIDPNGQARPKGRVTAAFEKLCTTKKLAGLYRVGDGLFPGFTDAAGRPIGMSQLSDGELDAFLFATSWVRSGIRRSVVLIDTPELHRSDAEARALVTSLASLEEDNQLIVATRAPGVIGLVPKDRLIQLG